MPSAAEVNRSDSNRSDASQKPRVSFNRDVHVKRIVPRDSSRVPGAVIGIDGDTVLTSPVRRERVKKSKKELADEAAKVISQADKVGCVANDKGTIPEKFYTLPNRKRNIKDNIRKEQDFYSLDRKSNKRRSSSELQPPKKPPRTFTSVSSPQSTAKPSIFDIFSKKPEKPKKSNLRRSLSDASALKSRAYGPVADDNPKVRRDGGDTEENVKKVNTKKQLSPIIEVTQREDYFTGDNKENIENSPKPEIRSESVTEQLKNYIDEVDEELYKETGIRITSTPRKRDPEPIIIDLDKAENISGTKKHKLNFGLGKKFKSLTQKKPKDRHETSAIEIAAKQSPTMIHSSQKPADKPPLTKGKTVNSMVKRLSSDSCSSPPPPTRTNVLIMPNVAVQHNNNQPFSYTRGVSPEKYKSNEDLPTKPVIYAQVVCGTKGTTNEKQTIHTTYNGRRQPQSDSDEGLGGEDSSGFTRKYETEKLSFTRFGDDHFESDTEKLLDEIDKYKAESPILPKYRPNFTSSYMERGRADGMDAKRRESLTENDQGFLRNDLSARRDLLESRINRRMNEKITPSPEYPKNNVYVVEKSSKYYRNGSTSPTGYKEKFVSETKKDAFGERRTESRTKKYFGAPDLSDSEPKSLDYRSAPMDTRHRYDSSQTINTRNRYRTSEKPKLVKDKTIYRSTPEMFHNSHQIPPRSYHDSLPREEKFVKTLNRQESDRRTDRLVDSGIENDIRRDSSENYRPTRPARTKHELYNESEDEGFASSLLITNEKHHTETNHHNPRKSRIDYDSDEFYRNKYIPRERSIDDGSHFDPRLDKDVIMKRANERKPPKAEKKSSLEKVKSLFTRDKKKDKTSTLQKQKSKSLHGIRQGDAKSSDYKNRRRLSTPSPSRDAPAPKRTESTHGSWFKSLDRLTRRKSDKHPKDGYMTTTEDEGTIITKKISSSASNLRFFGDTDPESNDDSVRGMKTHKKRTVSGLKSQSTRDLHDISEEKRAGHHKSLTNISETDFKGSRTSLKPPISPGNRYQRDLNHRDDRRRRKRPDLSSVESSTEGDSSQQSQRSIVYLHAATVGDIPGPGYLKSNTRAASREDLTSTNSSYIQPQVKTLSRSFSVLAPWRPRHQKEAMDIDYTQYNKQPRNGKYEQKSSKSGSNVNSTLKRKTQRSQPTLNRKSRSKENLTGLNRQSKEELSRGSTSTLYKKKEKLPRENSRYVRDDRKMPGKCQSVESISRKTDRDVSRSVSMPRDTEKTAGWFKKVKKSSSNQRL
ncbi:unnamed protein product [Ceutorhynchus assimilis]|uniref:Uncharacterized protein n=1 Tax=Ceutorhynchus assimilis TaxID=467358 RepID=A0A9N9QDZ1_9CUCU|nr:unnamed protein product [Ceutorhynchus assimilis]